MAKEIEVLTYEEKLAHAQRIALMHLEDAEYSIVYEDEELEDATEKEWHEIHDMIRDMVPMRPADV